MGGTVLEYAAQEIPQIDPPEAEKRAIYGWKLANTARVIIVVLMAPAIDLAFLGH